MWRKEMSKIDAPIASQLQLITTMIFIEFSLIFEWRCRSGDSAGVGEGADVGVHSVEAGGRKAIGLLRRSLHLATGRRNGRRRRLQRQLPRSHLGEPRIPQDRRGAHPHVLLRQRQVSTRCYTRTPLNVITWDFFFLDDHIKRLIRITGINYF